MTDTVDLLSSFLASKVCKWLDDPVIRIESTPADEVKQLRQQLEDMQSRYAALQLDYKRLSVKYGDEVNHSLVLEDILRDHNIRWR